MADPSRKRKQIDNADQAAADAPGQEVQAACPQVAVAPPPPRLHVVVPAPHALQNVILGQHADQMFGLSNVGGGTLQIGAVQLTVNPGNEFVIFEDHATDAQIQAGDLLLLDLTVRFTTSQVPQRNATMRITSNDPNSPMDVQITGTGRQLPVLWVAALTFGQNEAILNDQAGVNLVAPEWQGGALVVFVNHPVCYVRNTRVRITAQFSVTTAPSQNDQVNVRGTATFGGTQLRWTHNNLAVGTGGGTVTTPAMDSDNPLPNEVQCYDPATITWEYQTADHQWHAAGQTQLVVYTLLAAPADANKMFWTLIDMSCRGAAGETTQAGTVTNVFNSFQPAHPNAQATRKRDNTALTYWGANPTAQDLNALMAQPNGSGSCRAWSEILLGMYEIHGIAGGMLVEVKNWHRFSAPAASILAMLVQNVAGQNNGAPGRGFANHFIVRDPVNQDYYDPSYGNGPFANVGAWRPASLSYCFLNPNDMGMFQVDVDLQEPAPMTVFVTAGTYTLPANSQVTYLGAGILALGANTNLNLSMACTVQAPAVPPAAASAPTPCGPGAYTLQANHTLNVPANCVLTFPNQTAGFTAPAGGCVIALPANGLLRVPHHAVFSCNLGLEFQNLPGNDIAFIDNATGLLIEHG